VRLSSLTLKGEKLEPLNYSFKPNEVVINFLTKANNQAKIFDIYPDIDRYADFFMTCTSPEFRGQGLATEMYVRAIRLFQSKELKVCKSILTSPYTLKACRGLNFTENCTLFLKDYKDEQGNLYYPNATPDQCITVASKRI
jgi:predicted GNAT family acetyltransferase